MGHAVSAPVPLGEKARRIALAVGHEACIESRADTGSGVIPACAADAGAHLVAAIPTALLSCA